MAKAKELEQRKKIYGEKFMHLCRRLFPTLLEQEGILLEVLTSTFAANSRTLGQDIKPEQEEMFKNLIYSKIDVEQEEIQILAKKSPFELLSEAGYDLIECTSEKQIQRVRQCSISKMIGYYACLSKTEKDKKVLGKIRKDILYNSQGIVPDRFHVRCALWLIRSSPELLQTIYPAYLFIRTKQLAITRRFMQFCSPNRRKMLFSFYAK